MDKLSRIYVAGHRGLVGSALMRVLEQSGYENIVTRTSSSLDLRDAHAVAQFFKEERPEYVFLAAAKVGGIHANNVQRGAFIYDNLMIQTNVIHESMRSSVQKLLFLGSTCIYPREAPQPMPESCLLTGPLEYTNEPYAIAKIAGIKMCAAYNDQYGTNFLSVMPTNLYGPNDNYHPQHSHVLPALIRKCHEAKDSGAATVTLWGTGTPKREFLYSDDLGAACVFLMENFNAAQVGEVVNVGVGKDISIAELAVVIADVVGFKGQFVFDPSKPDGTPRKLVDVSRIHQLGWRAGISLQEGIQRAYLDFLSNHALVNA